jgi:putative hydrolase of the HAD superfamily
MRDGTRVIQRVDDLAPSSARERRTEMRFDALLLDFGGVISKTLFECRSEIERHFALPPGIVGWRGPFDPDADELWRSLAADGRADEYWHRRADELGRLAGRKVDMRDLIQAALGRDPNRMIRPEALETARAAKAAGCRVGILSNDLERLYGTETISTLDILGEIDCLVDGSRSGVLKPSPAAFARALAALGSGAERVVFVDDQPHNVAGARALGMTAVMFDICQVAASFQRIAAIIEL